MVSIITINYNGFAVTCELIESLKRFETYPYEVIVVDNASKENDGERLKELYPNVTVVCSATNLGFGGGNNLGYKHAQGDYILYMNNDMTIDAPFLELLVECLQQPGVGAVSPKIKYEYAPEVIQYAGFRPLSQVTLRSTMIGVGELDKGQYDVARPTEYVHGAAMMASCEVIDSVGPMTEIYFLFYEELDWSTRLKEAGYQRWYEPRAMVYHKESRSIIRGSAQREYFMTRSRVMFARRNRTGIYKFAACLYQVFLVMPRNVVHSLARREYGHAKAYFKGCIDGFMTQI